MKKAWRLKVSVDMDWCDQVVHSIRGAFRRLASRLGIRHSGPKKLWQDVRRCDYDDVRVMWDMLKKKKKNESTAKLGQQPPLPPPSSSAASAARMRSPPPWVNSFEWARCSCP
ncbi:hypothetical protein MLD38_001731 [Melastoma candidum]|uniref:Uncharacterized protein n=1 Tax=Melastoma candidum TaxID=119954 RepID=A0ACB9SFS2_9MYRT|nr:hypothetical protein MLD38_001731 [Melastoma candidum]